MAGRKNRCKGNANPNLHAGLVRQWLTSCLSAPNWSRSSEYRFRPNLLSCKTYLVLCLPASELRDLVSDMVIETDSRAHMKRHEVLAGGSRRKSPSLRPLRFKYSRRVFPKKESIYWTGIQRSRIKEGASLQRGRTLTLADRYE